MGGRAGTVTTSITLPREVFDLIRELAFERSRVGPRTLMSASRVVGEALHAREGELRRELTELRRRRRLGRRGGGSAA